MRPPDSYAIQSGKMPQPREVMRRPGDVLHRLAVRMGETSDDAARRARLMPWWRLVRVKRPVWARGWWCWSGKPMAPVQAAAVRGQR